MRRDEEIEQADNETMIRQHVTVPRDHPRQSEDRPHVRLKQEIVQFIVFLLIKSETTNLIFILGQASKF